MFKKLFRKSFVSISLVGIGTVLNAGLGFLYLSSVAKTLPLEEFGKYALLASLLVSLSKILDFGTNSLYVAQAITHDDKKLTDYFNSNKILQLLIAIPVSFLILFFFKLTTAQILLIFFAGLFFYGINYALFGIFQKEENYLMLVLLNTMPALVKGGFAALILLGAVNLEFTQYFTVFALSVAPSALLFFALPERYKNFSINFSRAKRTLKEALSPGISQLISEGFPAVGNSIAKISLGFSDVGIFSIADKISSAFVLVSFSIFTVLLPKNAARKRDKQSYDYTETLTLSAGVLLLSVVAIAIARVFIPWFFENKYDESLNLINLLVFSGALGSIHAFMENYFYVENKTKYLALISGGKLLYLVVLSAVLVPIMQLQGLAIAHLTASALSTATVFYLVFRKKEETSEELPSL